MAHTLKTTLTGNEIFQTAYDPDTGTNAGIAVSTVGAATSQLELISEGGNTGWRLLGRDPANYGDIGDGAVDLSVHTAPSATMGATGDNSFAQGLFATASGNTSFARNYLAVASGAGAMALHDFCTASGVLSMAWGNGATASGPYAATAWGDGTTASGTYNSTAFGWDTIASATCATAWGWSCEATGSYATAFGYNTTASETRATAWGEDTVASGRYSTVWGEGNTGNSRGVTVFGNFATVATGQSATTLVATDELLKVGNGTGTGARSDAWKMYKNSVQVHGGITATAASALTPEDGMFFYVTSTDATFTSIGFWGRENGAWVKL